MRIQMAAAVLIAASCTIAVVTAQQAPKTLPGVAAARLQVSGKQSFSGNPTHVACVGGQYYNQHSLGFVTRGSRVKVDIVAGDGVDPIASVVIIQMGPNTPNGMRATYSYDDDSGGGRDPRIEVTAEYDGNVMLSVGSYDGAAGCYAVKSELVP
jgi:hypothetical protein